MLSQIYGQNDGCRGFKEEMLNAYKWNHHSPYWIKKGCRFILCFISVFCDSCDLKEAHRAANKVSWICPILRMYNLICNSGRALNNNELKCTCLVFGGFYFIYETESLIDVTVYDTTYSPFNCWWKYWQLWVIHRVRSNTPHMEYNCSFWTKSSGFSFQMIFACNQIQCFH